MKVKELIEKLQKCNPDGHVTALNEKHNYYDVIIDVRDLHPDLPGTLYALEIEDA